MDGEARKGPLRADGAEGGEGGRFQRAGWVLRHSAGAEGLGRSPQGLSQGPEQEQRQGPGLWRHNGCAQRGRASSPQRLVWNLGLCRSGRRLRGRCKGRCGLRVGCESLDLIDPVSKVGDVGEDAGVDGVSAVKAPAG